MGELAIKEVINTTNSPCTLVTFSQSCNLQIQSLTLDQLETLSEALLDFSESSVLVDWLQEHQTD